MTGRRDSMVRGYTKSRPHDRTDYRTALCAVRTALCAVDGCGVCTTAQSITTAKSNLVDYCIQNETVFTHYSDNALTTGVKITTFMKITTVRHSY